MGKPKGLKKSDIDTMIELRKMGYTFKDIGKRFGISETSVRYHLNPHYKTIIKNKAKLQKRNPEYKRKMNENYMKRYYNEEEFRRKHIERAKRYQKENPDKKRQYNQNYLAKRANERARKEEVKSVIAGLCILLIITVIILGIINLLGG